MALLTSLLPPQGMFLNAPVRQRQLLISLSFSLLGFGLVLWVAANWAEFSRLMRFILVGGALTIAIMAGVVMTNFRLAASLCAMLAIGAFLALIGQTYQSGADPWQLFALWAVLSLPLCLAARHDAAWCLWVIIVFTALPLWQNAFGAFTFHSMNTETPFGVRILPLIINVLFSWIIAAGITFALMPTWPWADKLGLGRWSFRLSAICTLWMIASLGMFHVFIFNQTQIVPYLALIVLGSALLWQHMQKRPDMPILASTLFATISVAYALLCSLFLQNIGDMGSFLLLALLAAGLVAASAKYLNHRADALRAFEGVDPPLWPAIVLTGGGVLFAALPLVAFLVVVFDQILQQSGAPTVAGLLMIAGGVILLKKGKILDFSQQFGFVILVTGLIFVAGDLVLQLKVNYPVSIMLAIVLALAALAKIDWLNAILGFVSALLLKWAVIELFFHGDWYLYHGKFGLIIMGIAVVGALLLWFGAQFARLAFFAKGFVVGALTLLAFGAGQSFLISGMFGSILPEEARLAPVMIVPSVLCAGMAFLLTWYDRIEARNLVSMALGLAALFFSALSPMFGPALLIGALALKHRSNGLTIAALVTLLWIYGAYYYMLALPLHIKAYRLFAIGAVLLTLYALLKREPTTAASVAKPHKFAPALMLLSLMSTLVLGGRSIARNEAVLATGQPIYLALAPVDPRSLMQGDYMALNFVLPPRSDFSIAEKIGQNYIFAQGPRAANGLVHLETLHLTMPPAQEGKVIVRLLRKGSRWTAATDAFYFKEGTGERYEKAKFGRFKLAADGIMILEALADEAMIEIR